MSDDYEVGFGKPPKATQFQPGNQAARKRGRKKAKTLSLPDILDRALSTRKSVRRGDTVVTLHVAEIMIERIIGMAINGSARDVVRIMELLERHAPQLLEQQQQTLSVIYHRAEGSQVALPPADLWERHS